MTVSTYLDLRSRILQNEETILIEQNKKPTISNLRLIIIVAAHSPEDSFLIDFLPQYTPFFLKFTSTKSFSTAEAPLVSLLFLK